MRSRFIDFLIILCVIGICLLLYRIGYISNKIQEREKYKITAVKQASGRMRFFKEVDDEKVNIDKLELEDLMKRYDIIVEIEGD